MKGIPIKFRGIDIETGEYVYFRLEDDICGVGEYYRVGEDEYCHYAKIDELAQLIGYDVDGNEVYENDLLQSKLYIEDEGGKRFLMARVWFNRMVKNFMDGYEEESLNEPIVFNEAVVKDYGLSQVRKGNSNESQTV